MFLGAGARSKTSVRQKLVLKLAAALVNTTPSDGSVSASKFAVSAISSGVSMINGTLTNSVAGSALTVALKTLNNTDPTASDPIYVVVRNAAASNGFYGILTITSAISLVISSGSTLGASNGNVPFRIWLVCFDDAGTPRLALINCVNQSPTASAIYPLAQFQISTSNAEGGVGGADGLGTFYSSVNITSKAYTVLGYLSWETGLATAGTWSSTATRLELFRQGTPLPGALIFSAESRSGGVASGATAVPNDNTIPQSGEGDQYMSLTFTPSSAANVLRVQFQGDFAVSALDRVITSLFQDAVANALASVSQNFSTANRMNPTVLDWSQIAATSASTTFKIRAGAVGGATVTFNGEAAAALLGGVIGSYIRVQELQG